MRRSWGPAEHRIVAHRQKYLCASCGHMLPPTFEVDHILALADGGEDCYETNAQALCNGCHAAKTQRENIERTKRRRAAAQIAKSRDAEAKAAAFATPPLVPFVPIIIQPAPRSPRRSPLPTSVPPMPEENPFRMYEFDPDSDNRAR